MSTHRDSSAHLHVLHDARPALQPRRSLQPRGEAEAEVGHLQVRPRRRPQLHLGISPGRR